MVVSCESPCFGLRNARPNLDGANLGFAHRIAKMPKLMPSDLNGCTSKRLASRRRSRATPMPLGMTQQVMVRQHVHGEIAAKRSVAVAAVTTDSSDLDRALIEVDVVGLMSVGCGIGAGDRNVDWSVDRYVEVDETPREMAVAAGASAVATCRNDVRADQAQDGGEGTGVSANRSIAVSAVTPDTGHLKSGLIERHIVGLIGMGIGIVSRHGNIDRIIQRERCVNDAAIKVSGSAVASVVSTACDQIGVNPVVAGPKLRPGEGHASANRSIAVSAVTPDAGHLKSGLIERHTVRLIGMGIGIVSRHGNVDRIIQSERCVNDAAIEVSIAAVAGVVSTACDQIRVNPVVVGRVASPEDR